MQWLTKIYKKATVLIKESRNEKIALLKKRMENMCLWDGVLAFNKRDDDAAIAWGLAGVAFGVSTAAGIWGSSIFILSGPVGWIALGLGFGLVALANIFTDSALEHYFKFFLLSDHQKLEIGDNSPMDYNRLIYKNKEILVDSDDEDIKNTLMHPEDALATLYDLTVCTSINYYVEQRKMIRAGRRGRSTGYYIHSFGITMNFNNFLQNTNQLEAKGIIVRHTWVGGMEATAKAFDLTLKDVSITTLKNTQQQQLSAIVEIPDEKMKQIKKNKDLEFVLAIRIGIDKKKNHYFPHKLRNKSERYIGAKFKLHSSIYASSGENSVDKKSLVFDTLANLKLNKTW